MFTQSCRTDILHLEQGVFHFYIHLKIKLCCACETKIKFIFIVADGCVKPHKAVFSQPRCFIKRIPFIMQESVCQLNVLPVVKREWEAAWNFALRRLSLNLPTVWFLDLICPVLFGGLSSEQSILLLPLRMSLLSCSHSHSYHQVAPF